MKKNHRESLVQYVTTPVLGKKWIVDVLKDCSLEEFDQHVKFLEDEYGQYVRWSHISDIRREIARNLLI